MITKLYTVYRSELLGYCCMICGNRSDAEDLLQETFLRALSHLDVLEDLNETQQRAWLYKVARNAFYDLCRKRALEQSLPLPAEEGYDGGFSEAEAKLLLAVLPPDLSQVFIKRYFQGYSSGELAEEYGLTASGMRGMLRRARLLLQEKLKDSKEEET